jgi:phosphoribosyl 1,2-cyclic phosphate phosphodiesterase
MTAKVTILGCGNSVGVPRIGGDWGACDPDNPKNRRLRSSLLIERGSGNAKTNALIDTTPDCRQQLLSAGIGWVDGVLYTHRHADHTHGIDDLRVISFNGRRRVDVYYDQGTGEVLKNRFSYCFNSSPNGPYSQILNGHVIRPGEPVQIEGPGGQIEIMPFNQHHGDIDTLGFRIGGIAYSSDINGLPEESYPLLENLDVWIVDALRYEPHPSHFCVDDALAAIEQVRPKRAILTHMQIDLDYETLSRELPEGVEPAFDGLVLETNL